MDFILTISGVVFGGLLIITLVAAPVILIDRHFEIVRCNQINSNGTSSKYQGYFTGGCYVEVNGKYIPAENWRGEYQQ